MAFVSNQQDDEDEQKNNTVSPGGAGGSVHLAPSSGVGSAGSGATPTAASGAGGSFATIDKYLAANQGQAQPLANQITSGITNQYNTLDQGNQSTIAGLNSQVDSGYTKENTDLLSQEAANPVNFAADQNNVTGYQGQLNDKYTGPQSAEGSNSFQTQQAAINNAVAQGKSATQSEAGRQGLLSGIEKTPTAGVTALNSAIMSQDPNAQSSIEHAYDPFSNLTSTLSSGAQKVDQNIAGATAEANKASTDANNQIQGQVGTLNSGVQGKQQALQDQFNGYNANVATTGAKATADNSSIQNYLSNTPQVTADTSALNPYLNLQSLTGPAPTNATSADKGDYATQGALQTIAGSANPLNTVIDQSTASQAGTALPSNFAQLQQSLNGMPAAENTVLGNINTGLGTASAPALGAANQIQQFKDYENAAKQFGAFSGPHGVPQTPQQHYQGVVAQDKQDIASFVPTGHSGTTKANLQAKLAADQAQLDKANSVMAMPGAQNDTTIQKQADAQTIGGGQWINGADTGFNSLLGTLGSSYAPVAVNTLPTQSQVTPNTSDSGFGGFGNILSTIANPTTLNPVTLGLDKKLAGSI